MDLLVQRGGAVVVKDGVVTFKHDDRGLLGFCPVKRFVAKAMRAQSAGDGDETLDEAVGVLHEAAATRRAFEADLRGAITTLERSKDAKRSVVGDNLTGKWQLIYTTGTKDVQNASGGGDGSYFPITAVQSFDLQSRRIRNGVYLGPVKFFFDGPLRWIEKRNMLQFNFTKVSLALGPELGPWSRNIDDTTGVNWDDIGSEGSGDTKSKPGSKSNTPPFFTFVHADDKCIAARGRGGGVALWARRGEPETDAQQ